jgi:hypothetical protein
MRPKRSKLRPPLALPKDNTAAIDPPALPHEELDKVAERASGNLPWPGTLVHSADGLIMSSKTVRSPMPLPDDDTKRDNVVRLGTETLYAIGEELRRMYDADLRSQPSERLEHLMRRIQRGEGLP